MKRPYIIVSFLLFLLDFSNGQQEEHSELFIISKNPFTKCLMLKRCDVDILLRNDIKLEELVIQNDANHVITFNGYDPCEPSNTIKSSILCPLATDFNISAHQDQINVASYSVKKIIFDAILIGNSTVQVFVKRDNNFDPDNSLPSLVHRVLITAPRRPIDIIFDIWRWSFGSLISLCKRPFYSYN